MLDLSRPAIMGILNLTPDSFSDGGLCHRDGHLDRELILQRAAAMIEAGVDIIDVGGESTRPSATPVTVSEELERVVPAIEMLCSRFDIIISVDTGSPAVMKAATAAGATMINDVCALQRTGALTTAQQTGMPVVLMHMQGEPATMQDSPRYHDVVHDVMAFLETRKKQVIAAGIPVSHIILDPGFGFGKNLEHNLELLRNLSQLQALGSPLMVGLSRKSMLGTITGSPVNQRLAASVTAALIAVRQGARILRVHDVKATRDALLVWERVCQAHPAADTAA